MASFAKGQIVLYPFPYTDLSSRKLRPCLILSEQMGRDVLLCQITSKVQKDRFVVELKRDETLGGSLQIDSYIRTNMLFTADASQLQRVLCAVADSTYSQAVQMITQMIAKQSSA